MSQPGIFETAGPENVPGDLLSLLELEVIDANIFRANYTFDTGGLALYGGQVAAQALRAAGLTVGPDRVPHSLHGYFLRAGDAARPTLFQVFRDRDGRTYTARRVVATQDGEVIFNAATSFHVPEPGLDDQEPVLPHVPDPEECRPFSIPRLFSFEGRAVPQPYGDVVWPTRFWARCLQDLGDDPMLNACTLTYLSDISTGLSPFDQDGFAASASLDHAVWFHRPAKLGGWVLSDYTPYTVSGGRGWYTGSFFDASGVLVGSVAQEALFRRRESS